MSSSIIHITKWHAPCNNTHHHNLYMCRSTQGTLFQLSLSISLILISCLIIFTFKFIIKPEYPCVNQVSRTIMLPCFCQAYIIIIYISFFSSNSKYMLHTSVYPCHLTFVFMFIVMC